MGDKTEQIIQTREEYIRAIRAEMLGPGSEFSLPDAEHELLSSSPINRYSVGILYPQGNKVNLENDDSIPKEIEENEAESDDESEPSPEVVVDKAKAISPVEDDVENNLDEEVNMSSQYMPSSMGITFITSSDVMIVNGHISFGTYRDVKLASECMVPYIPATNPFVIPGELAARIAFDSDNNILSLKLPIERKDISMIKEKSGLPPSESQKFIHALYHLADYYSNGKIRIPHEAKFSVNFSANNYSDESINSNIDGCDLKITALKTPLDDGLCSITIMATNSISDEKPKSDNSIFQPIISISTNDNDFRIYENHNLNRRGQFDEEEQSLDLLYRNKKSFATGLGTSADWDVDENGNGSIWTEYMPVREVPSMDFNLPEGSPISNSDMSMKRFSDLDNSSRDEKISVIKKLVNLYGDWVHSLKNEAKSLDKRFELAAQSNIQKCTDIYDRMCSGIEILEKNDTAYTAFELANRAMFMQRVHLKLQDTYKNEDCLPDNEAISNRLRNIDYYNETDDSSTKCWWRPFQLAFIILNIKSIIEPESEERNLVDLIWFPTGGGKTEAYLGLSAFSIFYRRLAYGAQAGGTSIIMRYTLRLLTAQQFTRASTLICACEYIRNDYRNRMTRYPKYNLGEEPITIGLWIGGSHVPNKAADAKDQLEKLQQASSPSYLNQAKENNKFQVLKCPWCGTKMTKEVVDGKIVGKWGYGLRMGTHFYMHCTNESCHFMPELPIQIIDEELYKKPPTLLFGTVDKFAMMTWLKETGAFFAANSDNRPPELIIQDELHLISGSLGTMVGLFESAIDALCSQKGVAPKIIASTATIRRASEQCSNLYNRDIAQFPAPGLNAEDSFFAKEKTIDYEKGDYGRKYVGIMPSGKTKVMTEVRTIAAMLQLFYEEKVDDYLKDAFWTVTAYYSSLKDLGKASSLANDDIKDFIVRIANRHLVGRRPYIKVKELTSRVSTSELNDSLNDLEKSVYTSEAPASSSPISLVLATNMISVGIDVARLNAMYILGQPKLTSEYIQASSRVGRSYPGVIFVQYDATKSRDRSHYENFISYHDSFYKYVEPTAVTPFSRPALDRALHSAIVAIIRQQIPELADEKNAGLFVKDKYLSIINNIKQFFAERAELINSRSITGADIDIDNLSRSIDLFFDEWNLLAESCRNSEPRAELYYGKNDMRKPKTDDNRKRLLITFDIGNNDGLRRTQTSMRSVDSSVTGKIIIEDQ